MADEYVGPTEAAELYGVGADTFLSWRKAGFLDGKVRIQELPSGRQRFNKQDIIDSLKPINNKENSDD